LCDETDAAGADWLGNEESSITTRYGLMFCLLRAFSAMVGTAAAGAPAASAMSHDLTHPRMSWANIHFFLLSLVTLSVALHSDTNTAVFSVDTHHGSFADNGSCALLFNTKIEREREMSISIIVFHLLLSVSPLPTVLPDRKRKWMDTGKISSFVFLFTRFSFAPIPPMVNGSLGHECLMIEKVSFYFILFFGWSRADTVHFRPGRR
jgi:hypothetical protein